MANNKTITTITSDLSLLPPTSDYVFCNLFGSEDNTDCLMSLLNSILKGNPVVYELKLKPTEHKKRTEDGKSIRADILADINNGTIVNIEMQCSNLQNSIDRMLFYQAIHRSRSINESDDYRSMPQIISIWILTRTMYNDLDRCMHEIKMALYTEEGIYIREASDKERIIIIELEKLPSYIEKLRQEHTEYMEHTEHTEQRQLKLDYFSAWMSFLTNPLNMPKECNDIDKIHKALETLQGMSNNPDIRAEYNQVMREKRDATHNHNEGVREGEKKKAIETANRMLDDGMSLSVVAKYIGLTEEEILKLKQDMN